MVLSATTTAVYKEAGSYMDSSLYVSQLLPDISLLIVFVITYDSVLK